MKISKDVRSNIKPDLKETNDYFIYVRENIREEKVIISGEETPVYIYDEYEYNKDEYIDKIENEHLEYRTTQNRILLNSKFTADRGEFRVDIINMTESIRTLDVDLDTFNLTKSVIEVGAGNYDLGVMESIIDFYTMVGKISFEMADELFLLLDSNAI